MIYVHLLGGCEVYRRFWGQLGNLEPVWTAVSGEDLTSRPAAEASLWDMLCVQLHLMKPGCNPPRLVPVITCTAPQPKFCQVTVWSINAFLCSHFIKDPRCVCVRVFCIQAWGL